MEWTLNAFCSNLILTTVLIDGLEQITIFTIRSIRGGRTAGLGGYINAKALSGTEKKQG